MKIGFVTSEFPHLKTGTSGGIGTSILNLSKGLIHLGHSVSIFIYGQNCDAIFTDSGITIYKIKNTKVKGLTLLLTQVKVQKLLNKLFKENKLDIVEAPDWMGFTSFIKLKCPLIVKIHGSDTLFCHIENRPVKFKNKFLEKKALQNCDGIIAVSQFAGNLSKQLFQLPSKFTVIPNTVDLSQFQSDSSPNTSQTILYFGTLIRKKGMLELPFIFNEVIAQNPDAKLLLIGKDAFDIATKSQSTWQLMQTLFTATALKNVTYLGSISYSDIKHLIQKATVCVFPTFAEALPVSWLEAMAMQKPIVASHSGWANEIIDENRNGFLENPKNHFKFAQKINAILTDTTLQVQLGNQARKKVGSHFSNDIIAQQTVHFYQKFLKQ